ncbi:MAG: ATP-binding protein [Pseudomonadota bacterium]
MLSNEKYEPDRPRQAPLPSGEPLPEKKPRAGEKATVDIPTVVIQHDLELRVVFVNEAFEEVFGMPKEEALGHSPMEFLPEFEREHRTAIIKRLRKVIRTGKKSEEHEFTYISPGGEYRFLSAMSIPIFDVDNNMTNVLSIIMDLTRQKELEKKNIKKAQVAYITDMAFTLAHEISNPLTGIKLGLATLYDSLQKKENIDVLDSVLNDLNRIQDIVNSILRKKNTQPRLKKVKSSIMAAKIKEVLFHLTGRIENKKIIVKTEIYGTDAQIAIDCDKMYQVLLNILINAIDAVPEGGSIEIKMGPKRNSPARDVNGQDHITVSVADNGLGLDREALGNVFNPFFSLKPNGTGLGLSICREIVDQHGGVIEVQSEMGLGTRVTLALPTC